MPKVGNKKFPYTAKGKADAAESKRQRAMRPKAKKEPTAAQRRQTRKRRNPSVCESIQTVTRRRLSAPFSKPKNVQKLHG
jgi:hypothetical protein